MQAIVNNFVFVLAMGYLARAVPFDNKTATAGEPILSAANDETIIGPVQWFTTRRMATTLCGSSSFLSHPSIASPYSADCVALAEDLRSNNGYYIARLFPDNTTLASLATAGTCTFGVRPAASEDLSNWHWHIGNEDMATLIDVVVSGQHSSPGGHVGASGMTRCSLPSSGTSMVQSGACTTSTKLLMPALCRSPSLRMSATMPPPRRSKA